MKKKRNRNDFNSDYNSFRKSTRVEFNEHVKFISWGCGLCFFIYDNHKEYDAWKMKAAFGVPNTNEM